MMTVREGGVSDSLRIFNEGTENCSFTQMVNHLLPKCLPKQVVAQKPTGEAQDDFEALVPRVSVGQQH